MVDTEWQESTRLSSWRVWSNTQTQSLWNYLDYTIEHRECQTRSENKVTFKSFPDPNKVDNISLHPGLLVLELHLWIKVLTIHVSVYKIVQKRASKLDLKKSTHFRDFRLFNCDFAGCPCGSTAQIAPELYNVINNVLRSLNLTYNTKADLIRVQTIYLLQVCSIINCVAIISSCPL